MFPHLVSKNVHCSSILDCFPCCCPTEWICVQVPWEIMPIKFIRSPQIQYMKEEEAKNPKRPFFLSLSKKWPFFRGRSKRERELIKYSLHHLGSQKESCHFRSLFLPILQKSKSSSDRKGENGKLLFTLLLFHYSLVLAEVHLIKLDCKMSLRWTVSPFSTLICQNKKR